LRLWDASRSWARFVGQSRACRSVISSVLFCVSFSAGFAGSAFTVVAAIAA